MTNVKSLLALYLKMGGALTDTYADIAGGVPVGQYSTISDAILACSKKYSSGGGSLPADFPAEGAANANKYVGFDENGYYTAKDGAEKFVVTLTEDNGTYTADETIADIYAASQDGKDVVVDVSYAGAVQRFPLVCATDVGGDTYAAIAGGVGMTENVTAFLAVGIVEGGSDAWRVDITEVGDELPSYSASNNGQVLGVSLGSLAWVDKGTITTPATMNETTGKFESGLTLGEILTAFLAGNHITMVYDQSDAKVALAVVAALYVDDGYAVVYCGLNGSLVTATGDANEKVEILLS